MVTRAPKKPAAVPEPPKPQGKSIAKWEERLAARAKASKKVVADVGLGKFISTQGGVLQYNGLEIPGNVLNCVIIESMLENTYYDVKFDTNNPTPPACYAYALVSADDSDAEIIMRPHEKAANPQHETCKGCPQNEWGTADTGRGKACSNRRRLALVLESDLDNVRAADVAYIKLPVTSVKGWAGYVRSLESTFPGKPPLCFVTEIGVVRDPNDQFHLTFSVASEVDEEYYEALMDKQDSVAVDMVAPYPDAPAEAAKPAPRGRPGVAPKFAGRPRK